LFFPVSLFLGEASSFWLMLESMENRLRFGLSDGASFVDAPSFYDAFGSFSACCQTAFFQS
jgi:hypothetical protein